MSEIYTKFVRSLFKTYSDTEDFLSGDRKSLVPVRGYALTLHHATTGLMGEVVELFAATDRAHILEELGDVEFYFEAFLQNYDRPDFVQSVRANKHRDNCNILLLIIEAAALLDATKKLWIYNKPLDDGLRFNLEVAIINFRRVLNNYEECVGLPRSEVILHNQRKLGKRYPTGYSDAAAQARADKEPGDD